MAAMSVEPGRYYLKARSGWPRWIEMIDCGDVIYVDPWNWGRCDIYTFRKWAERPMEDADRAEHLEDIEKTQALRKRGPIQVMGFR